MPATRSLRPAIFWAVDVAAADVDDLEKDSTVMDEDPAVDVDDAASVTVEVIVCVDWTAATDCECVENARIISR
jgi:hypothetical protein